jgi:hypothetical protein
MDAPVQDCTIEQQRGVARFLCAEGVKHVEIHRRVWLSMDRAPLVNERCMSGWKGGVARSQIHFRWGSEGRAAHLASRAAEKLLLRRNTETS